MQPARIPQPNDIAHSTPLETVVEVGIPAAIVAFAIVLLPWWICLRGALTRRRAQRYLPAAAFAVAGVAILHSTVDFSLQIPAIGFVTSAMLGLGWAQAFGRRERSSGDLYALGVDQLYSSRVQVCRGGILTWVIEEVAL